MAIKSIIEENLPLIYCYSTPGISYHDGWVKIGYTEQTIEQRNKYLTTGGIKWVDEWHEFAVYTDGSGIVFTDDDFRSYLISKGVNYKNNFGENDESIGDEWYEITPEKAKEYLDEFKKAPSVVKQLRAYKLRDEQKRVVSETKAMADGESTEALWNAKPRFGKCLSCYAFCKEMTAKRVLIVTNRPSVATSWYSDYQQYIGEESGLLFVSHVSDIAKEKGVIDYPEYKKKIKYMGDDAYGLIYFVSLQDIKGSRYFGTGGYAKLKELTQIEWDILVVDESHEGVETYKTDSAFNYIKRRFTLYLSGTPFKAIADEKFDDDEICNWTYVDEQEAKERWNGEGANPYHIMPKLNMLTYRLDNILGGGAIDFSGEDSTSVTDGMNELFRYVDGKFVHNTEVDKFLDVISSDKKYPFSTAESRSSLKHTFWLMQSVGDTETANVKALAKKLRKHPIFGQYTIVVAADNGKIDEDDKVVESHYKRVMQAIKDCDNGTSGTQGTITLSVKSLTTGVTVPQWTGVLMLSERNSASEYMQASFRAQNPYIFSKTNDMTGETVLYRKTDAYVFDFNPAHTLEIVEGFANNLCSDTVNGNGTFEERKSNVEHLLKYMPVTGEDESGTMTPFDADTVMLIPRKLRAEDVVRHGFMCDSLFQNITKVFWISGKGMAIVGEKLPVCTKKGVSVVDSPLSVTQDDIDSMHLNADGDIEVTDAEAEKDISATITPSMVTTTKNTVATAVKNAKVSPKTKDDEKDKERATFVQTYSQTVTNKVTEDIKNQNKDAVTKSVENAMRRKVAKQAKLVANNLYSDYVRDTQLKEDEIRDTLGECTTEEDKQALDELIQEASAQAVAEFTQKTMASLDSAIHDAYIVADKEKEVAQATQLRNTKLDEFKKRLKSFTRTIPSFLMAYGDEDFTLENMDTYVDADVFKEVAYITVDDFRVLRDECQYFDSVVCNDAMQNFLHKRELLADYFDENSFIQMGDIRVEDIFDLIPPQQTNQIYTPKDVVAKMCDRLQDRQPGCFDAPDKTFIDLYMKSGLYITEIVKRLFRSPSLIALYPDENERLQHIFDRQVYGLAPTPIIYKIATRYILGFAELRGLQINTEHFKELDALPYAKGEMPESLEEKLESLFGEISENLLDNDADDVV